MKVKVSDCCRMRSEIVMSQLFLVLESYFLMIYGYLISNISNAKIYLSTFFNFPLDVKSLYCRLQYLVPTLQLRTEKAIDRSPFPSVAAVYRNVWVFYGKNKCMI